MKSLFLMFFLLTSCSAMTTVNETKSLSRVQECWNSKKLACIKKYFGNPQKEQTSSISYFQNENEYLIVFFDKEKQLINGIQFWLHSPLSLDSDAVKKILVSNDWQIENLPEKNPHVVNLAMTNYSIKLGASFLTYQVNKTKPVRVIYWGADYRNLEF